MTIGFNKNASMPIATSIVFTFALSKSIEERWIVNENDGNIEIDSERRGENNVRSRRLCLSWRMKKKAENEIRIATAAVKQFVRFEGSHLHALERQRLLLFALQKLNAVKFQSHMPLGHWGTRMIV